MSSPIEPDYRPHAGAVVAPRSHLNSDAPRLDLGGDWDFELAVGGTVRSGTMPVPAHWVLVDDGAWGAPAYTNVQYPFPVDPPHVPDANPTGTYRRTFNLSPEWPSTGSTLLRLLGAESEASVSLNGHEIGMTRGSRLTREFDLTADLRSGDNQLTIVVRQWSPGSYLEDQDQWWLPGIFRDVELLHRPVGGIEDVWLRCDFDPSSGRGSVDPEVRADATAWPLRLSVPELGVALEWADPDSVASFDIGPVQPWSAETPRLYSATVASASEIITVALGFRRTEIVDGVWLLNGQPLKLAGVNRHEVDPERGRVFDEEAARADLALMKAFNVNAIRTSHYPPHPRLLDLTDELGFYVMLENDYETHGFEFDGWVDNPSGDPRWSDAILDRMRRSVERDKNHASVVAWSLGNEAHTGGNLAAASAWTHDRDPGRPVHYEGDFENAYTDLHSRMYPTTDEVALVLDGTGPIARPEHEASRVGGACAARVRTLPYVLCEYAHAMGTGPGGIEGYIDAMTHRRHAGGFVWEWRDHALSRLLPDGRRALGYGGDFGEPVHDGNFVCDGLIGARSEVSAGLLAWANLVAPVVAVPEASGRIVVTSRNQHATASGLVVSWEAVGAGTLLSGEMALPSIPPGGSVEVRADLAEASWAGLCAAVLDPVVGGIARRTPTEIDPAGGRPGLPGVGENDDRGRRVMSVRQVVVRGDDARPSGLAASDPGSPIALLRSLRPTLFRAPTDNDRGHGLGGPSAADRWAEARLHLLEHRVTERPDGQTIVSGVPSRQRRLRTEIGWTPEASGWAVEVSFAFEGEWPDVVGRIGLTAPLPAASWGDARVSWFGLGPTENYPDLTGGVRLGTFVGAVDELWAATIRPQEAGHRGGVRLLRLDGSDATLSFDFALASGAWPGFSVCRWTPQQLSDARHAEELPPSDTVWLTLDASYRGLGTASCGPDVGPEFELSPLAASMTFHVAMGG